MDSQMGMFAARSHAERFMAIAKPDAAGFSRVVYVEELPADMRFGNGAGWARDDSAFGRKYYLDRAKSGGRIISVQMRGLRDGIPAKSPIPPFVRKALAGEPCALMAAGKTEIDHKAGRGAEMRKQASELTVDDFQPLSKAANNVKRSHCKDCVAKDKRFDARRLDFAVGWTDGGEEWLGTCKGCFWHDIRAFRARTSAESA